MVLLKTWNMPEEIYLYLFKQYVVNIGTKISWLILKICVMFTSQKWEKASYSIVFLLINMEMHSGV